VCRRDSRRRRLSVSDSCCCDEASVVASLSWYRHPAAAAGVIIINEWCSASAAAAAAAARCRPYVAERSLRLRKTLTIIGWFLPAERHRESAIERLKRAGFNPTQRTQQTQRTQRTQRQRCFNPCASVLASATYFLRSLHTLCSAVATRTDFLVRCTCWPSFSDDFLGRGF